MQKIVMFFMQIEVYDTWVKGKNGTIHFDVYLETKGRGGGQSEKAVKHAKEFLKTIGEENAKITAEECSFCHIQGINPEIEAEIKKNGYYIYKMSGC